MKFSQYNVELETNYGILVYNTASAKIMKIKKPELIDRFKELSNKDNLDINDEFVKVMYTGGFVVDNDKDEFAEAKKRGDLALNDDSFVEILLHVTERCNFKCAYCFKEQHPKDLSDEKWESLYKYLYNGVSDGKLKYIRISFYGGEPLLKYEKIVEFMNRIEKLKNDYNITTDYAITTNGYLLTPDVYNKITKAGIDFFQISVDGFEESHNKTRPLAGGGGSWKKIMENLEYINTVDDNVQIVIRTNFNSKTEQEVVEFEKWFYEKFSKDKFKFHKSAISKYTEMVDDSLVADVEGEFCKELRFNDLASSIGSMQLGGACCRYCNNKNVIAMSVEGKIANCEEFYHEEAIVGELSNNGTIEYYENANGWSERFLQDECKTCIVYPLCYARICAKARKCWFVKQEFEIVKQQMKEGKLFGEKPVS